MGQGSDSCGGWEIEYDPYSEGLATGRWTMRHGGDIHITKMSSSHITNTIRICRSKKECATFTDEEEKWQDWIDAFETELESRKLKQKLVQQSIVSSTKPVAPTRGAKVTMVCHCNKEYQARLADVNRGWALSCSKSCAAIRRIHHKPAARIK